VCGMHQRKDQLKDRPPTTRERRLPGSGAGDDVVAEAGYEVVVDEAGGLHQGVDNCASDEAETALY